MRPYVLSLHFFPYSALSQAEHFGPRHVNYISLILVESALYSSVRTVIFGRAYAWLAVHVPPCTHMTETPESRGADLFAQADTSRRSREETTLMTFARLSAPVTDVTVRGLICLPA